MARGYVVFWPLYTLRFLSALRLSVVFKMTPSWFYVVLASLLASVCAQNTPPPIIVPKSGDVWKAGDRQTVKW